MAILNEVQLQPLPWVGGPEYYHRSLSSAHDSFCLNSGLAGRFSYVGWDPHVRVRFFPHHLEARWGETVERFQENPFSWMPDFSSFSPRKPSPFLASGWVGFFGYEAAPFADESLPRRGLPDDFLLGAFGLYDPVLVFDHQGQKAWAASWGLTEDMKSNEGLAKERLQKALKLLNPPPDAPSPSGPLWEGICSNFTQEAYERAVRRILDYIQAGDAYQVNLSQKFSFEWMKNRDPLGEFWRKEKAHPSPYSAFFDLGDLQILSFSPEEFLKIQGNEIRTRPIKGTRRRSLDPSEDQKIRQDLYSSPKDDAELLMIVDLERNDLGKICRPGSVRVTRLKEVETFDYVHHLVATVQGEIQEGLSPLGAVAALFPGGSITGAPKRRAMEIIQELEGEPRGIYTGVIGFLDFSRAGLFNIAIRTLEIREGLASFGVGGGIVAESDPKAEYEETLTKAQVFLD